MAGNHAHTILITSDTVGGVWSYTISLLQAMQHYPVKFVLATLGPLPNDKQRQQVADLPNVKLESFEGKLEWMDNPWDDLREEANWFRDLNTTYQPDLVHLNHYAHAALNFNAPKLLVMHSCVKSWWRAVKGYEAPDYWSRYGALVQKAILSSDKVIAPSHSILKAYRFEYQGLNDAEVIYNGLKVNDYQAEEKEKFVFSMGRIWDEAKNIKLLVKAAQYTDFKIVIAGRTEQQLEYCPENVQILGWKHPAEVKEFLSQASIYALPVKYEPFGLSFLEAAASGCALIGGKISTLNEIWSDAAFYCDTNNPQELATLINVLMKDEQLIKSQQLKALEKSKSYKLKTTATQYFNLYKSLNSIFATYEY